MKGSILNGLDVRMGYIPRTEHGVYLFQLTEPLTQWCSGTTTLEAPLRGTLWSTRIVPPPTSSTGTSSFSTWYGTETKFKHFVVH